MPIDASIALDIMQGLPIIFALASANIPFNELLLMLFSSVSVFDSNMLLFINHHSTEAVDGVMLTLTNKWFWVPFYCLLIAALFIRHSWKHALLGLGLAILAVAITDQTCASLLRPMVARLRPSNPDNPLSALIHTVNGYRGGKYGFPSCHAANSAALAVFLVLYFRNRIATGILLTWSVLQCYTRLYLGVHYPSDILCGLIIGSTAACFCYAMLRIIAWMMQHTRPLTAEVPVGVYGAKKARHG